MTIEEALEQMKKRKGCLLEDFYECTKRVCCECPHSHDEDAMADVFGIAIECMEKQIPKKPTLEGDGYADGELVYDTWICPCCNHYYEVDYDDFDFCPKCGQKLDWSEEE